MKRTKQKHILGQKVSYPEKYDPEVLVRIPRGENRQQIPYNQINRPVFGFDIWHAWEAGFLLDSGLPCAGVLKIQIPASSPFLVESKSLKLYLNSYNMERMGANPDLAWKRFTETVQKDLSALLECDIYVYGFEQPAFATENEFWNYQLLEELVDSTEVSGFKYRENPGFLIGEPAGTTLRFRVRSELLRSRCKVTHQPDWGTVFIDIQSEYDIDFTGLLKYIVSFRNENHFHEEICETIFSRMYEKFTPKELMVSCVYTRRGGIDISPLRSTTAELIPDSFVKPTCLHPKMFRQ